MLPGEMKKEKKKKSEDQLGIMSTDQWEKMVAVMEIGRGTQGHAQRLGDASSQISLHFSLCRLLLLLD